MNFLSETQIKNSEKGTSPYTKQLSLTDGEFVTVQTKTARKVEYHSLPSESTPGLYECL